MGSILTAIGLIFAVVSVVAAWMNPELTTDEKWRATGKGVGDVLLEFLPDFGIGLLTKADDVGEVARAVENTDDLVRGLENAEDGASAVQDVADAAKANGYGGTRETWQRQWDRGLRLSGDPPRWKRPTTPDAPTSTPDAHSGSGASPGGMDQLRDGWRNHDPESAPEWLRMIWRARRGAALLSVDGHVRWRCGGVEARMALDQAEAVFVARPNLLGQATRYLLIGQINGHPVRLAFAEHWLSGARAMAQARALAALLSVPLVDPSGELWRRSWFPPARWLGQGQEWKVLLGVAALALGLSLAGLVRGL